MWTDQQVDESLLERSSVVVFEAFKDVADRHAAFQQFPTLEYSIECCSDMINSPAYKSWVALSSEGLILSSLSFHPFDPFLSDQIQQT